MKSPAAGNLGNGAQGRFNRRPAAAVLVALGLGSPLSPAARPTAPSAPAAAGPQATALTNVRYGYAIRIPKGWEVSTLDGLPTAQSGSWFLHPPAASSTISQDGPFITVNVCRAWICRPNDGAKVVSVVKRPATLGGILGMSFHYRLETKEATRAWTEDHLVVQRDGFTYDLMLSLTSMGANRLPGSLVQPAAAFRVTQKSWTWKSPQDALSTSFQHVYVTATVTGVAEQSGVLKSLTVRVDQNLSQGRTPTADPNTPFKLGSTLTVAFNQVLPPGLATLVRMGDRLSLPLVRDGSGWRSELESYMVQNDWIQLQSPLPGQTVAPGQTIHFAGTVGEKNLWGQKINVDALAGFRKPSNSFAQATMPIGSNGSVDFNLTLPDQPFPALNGNGITIILQAFVRQGPIRQVILLPAAG